MDRVRRVRKRAGKQCGILARQLDIGELIAAGDDNNAVIVIVVTMLIMPVIMAASFVVLRGDGAGSILNRHVRTDGANMIGTTMQTLHVAPSGESV